MSQQDKNPESCVSWSWGVPAWSQRRNHTWKSLSGNQGLHSNNKLAAQFLQGAQSSHCSWKSSSSCALESGQSQQSKLILTEKAENPPRTAAQHWGATGAPLAPKLPVLGAPAELHRNWSGSNTDKMIPAQTWVMFQKVLQIFGTTEVAPELSQAWSSSRRYAVLRPRAQSSCFWSFAALPLCCLHWLLHSTLVLLAHFYFPVFSTCTCKTSHTHYHKYTYCKLTWVNNKCRYCTVIGTRFTGIEQEIFDKFGPLLKKPSQIPH